MKNKITAYLGNCFAARQLPTIAWGAFLPFLASCVKADGGSYDEFHGILEFPPSITGGAWMSISTTEIFEKWWEKK